MIISADLFRSDELKAWALDNSVAGQCEVSGKTFSLFDTAQLSDFFSALFSMFEEDARIGNFLKTILCLKWYYLSYCRNWVHH